MSHHDKAVVVTHVLLRWLLGLHTTLEPPGRPEVEASFPSPATWLRKQFSVKRRFWLFLVSFYLVKLQVISAVAQIFVSGTSRFITWIVQDDSEVLVPLGPLVSKAGLGIWTFEKWTQFWRRGTWSVLQITSDCGRRIQHGTANTGSSFVFVLFLCTLCTDTIPHASILSWGT
jgi:hypothetical protein